MRTILYLPIVSPMQHLFEDSAYLKVSCHKYICTFNIYSIHTRTKERKDFEERTYNERASRYCTLTLN